MMKILVTIGPASLNKRALQSFSRKTNLFRLNGSHGTLEWHDDAIKRIRSVCPDAFIMMDIPGIKPRTNNLKNINIGKGEEVQFGIAASTTTNKSISLTKDLPTRARSYTSFSVNDGQYEFDVVESGEKFVIGKSRSDFTLLPKKGINIPGSVYDEAKQADIYKKFIKSIEHFDIDALGLSFVQTGDLVDEIREVVPNLVLVSKVENSEGLRNCTEIIRRSDAIMIGRGDLAAEIGLENLFRAIATIADETKGYGKPLIMATENLETMLHRNVPSKSEVISIAFSASIGSDCIMLSEETATSTSGQEIVIWLSSFLNACNRVSARRSLDVEVNKFPGIWTSLSNLSNLPVILMTKSGYALHTYFSVRPEGEVMVITDNPKLVKICSLYSNNVTLVVRPVGDKPLDTLREVVELNKHQLFAETSQIAALYVSNYVNTARANSITIFDHNDFGL